MGRRLSSRDSDQRSGHLRGTCARFYGASIRQVSAPGTFGGLREKIPYLKSLGVNCLELLPIFEFDEWDNNRLHPETGELLLNYWGYSTVGFFAPKAGYAATGGLGMQVDEVKNLIKELHRAGIEVMLDVVFNHTAEGDQRGPYISYRGIDNRTYYILTPGGKLLQFLRMRQHVELQPPGGSQHGARLSALLGVRVPH